MEKLTQEDRERGSLYIVKALKAQINAMKLSMNKDYLIFMNITLFNEVIRKFISPQCSQYVIVALTRGGMVHTNKLLWEFLIYKKEWLRNKEENIARQKEQATMEKLKKMQKPAGVQIDERVHARIDGKMDSTVVATVRNILADNLHPMAFKNPGSKNKKKHKSRSGNKKHKSGQANPVILQTTGIPNIAAPIPPASINTTATILPTQIEQPTLS